MEAKAAKSDGVVAGIQKITQAVASNILAVWEVFKLKDVNENINVADEQKIVLDVNKYAKNVDLHGEVRLNSVLSKTIHQSK